MRVERPVNAAYPAPGDDDIFSMSKAMMKFEANHSDGGMETDSNDEWSPRTFESWYHASCMLDIGRSGNRRLPVENWNRHPSPLAGEY